jgi:hypothetical protein
MVKFSDFDLDFRDGKEGEDLVEGVLKDILTGTIEVKRDMKWIKTGNIYIETECFYQSSGQWEMSGLSVTKATHWAFVLENFVLILPTEDLKEIVDVEGHPISTDIEPNPTRGFLIKIDNIVRKYRYGAS